MSSHQSSAWVRRLRDQAERSGWTLQETVDAVEAEAGKRGESVSRLAAYRMAHGWTQSDVARQLAMRDNASQDRLTTQLVSRWERGIQRPDPEHMDALCRLFRTNCQQLGYPAPDYTVETNEAPTTQIVEAGVGRRSLLRGLTIGGMSAALLTPQISSALADVRQQVDNSLEASEVAGSTVERWEHTVRRYAEAYEIAPPLQALVDAAQDVAVVREQRERPQSLNQKQRLTRVVAQLSILIASYSRELGDYRASRNWSHTARLAAEDVGDRTLRAWVMARDSMAPLYEGNFAGAIELAQGAEILAGAGPSPAAVLAPVVRARALAQVGRADEARKTIEHAHTAFDRLGHDGQRDLLFGYTERQLCFHSAQVWTYTQDFDDAQHAHERATVLYAPTEYLDRALMGLDMALRLVATGNADSAAEHAASVITGLESGQRSSMIEGRARAVLRALPAKARHTNAVETYRDALVGIQSASGRNERN